jgi:hypothetical protein
MTKGGTECRLAKGGAFAVVSTRLARRRLANHCRRREAQGIEDVHAGVLCRPSLSLPGESLCERRKDLREPECHFELALPRREGVYDPEAGVSFRRQPSPEGQEFDRVDLLLRSFPASGARGGKILDDDQAGLVAREQLIYLAVQAASLCGYDFLAPIHEKCRSFEDAKGEAP